MTIKSVKDTLRELREKVDRAKTGGGRGEVVSFQAVEWSNGKEMEESKFQEVEGWIRGGTSFEEESASIDSLEK